MIVNFRSSQSDFRGGGKSKTHRRNGGVPVFPVFPGCSLEGYACAPARTCDLPLENRREIQETPEIALPSCGQYFPPAGCGWEIGREIGVMGA